MIQRFVMVYSTLMTKRVFLHFRNMFVCMFLFAIIDNKSFKDRSFSNPPINEPQ